MEKIDSTSVNLEKSNIEKLETIFPNVVNEGKVDFDALKAVLGEEIDDSKEMYQFTWKGKSKAIKIAQQPSTTTLRPCKEKSKDWDITQNIYIEGDNLEVLKQLQKTYFKKIKMIYIDPPYNTGHDFVYKDDFTDSIENYVEQTNQASSSNPETSGRYHTDWLNMMYPRLILARNLLKDDGVIFVSIDDCEQSNLKKMMDDIFGENNFVANLIWQKKFSRSNDATYFSTMHDHILCYCKQNISLNENGWEIGLLPRGDELPSGYSNPDNDPRGPWTSTIMSAKSGSKNLLYEITTPSGRKVVPPSGRYWSCSEETFNQWKADNRIWFGQNGDGTPRKKTFLSEVQQGLRPNTILFHEEAGNNQEAKQEVKALFNGVGVFDGPKPVRLIELLITIANVKEEDIVLDFFSGSATTAHAMFKSNEKGRKNKFILVQLPELCSEESEAYVNGYRNLCEIGEERIRRAGEELKREWNKLNDLEGLFKNNEIYPFDIGFKVFKLDSTNIKPWDNLSIQDETNLLNYNEIFKEGRTKEDVLYEIMLKYGIFDQPATSEKINGKDMFKVGSRYMIVCLEDEITTEDIKKINELKPRVVVFKESGFANDNDKINAVYNLEKAGVEDVRCI